MDKQASSKGFTLIEVIVVLVILMGSGLLVKTGQPQNLNSKNFTSSLVHLQYMALLKHTQLEYTGDIITEYPIRYNANGNINMGQTVLFAAKEITVLIGTGKIHEERIHDD